MNVHAVLKEASCSCNPSCDNGSTVTYAHMLSELQVPILAIVQKEVLNQEKEGGSGKKEIYANPKPQDK